jgi:HEAT repeat protein
MMLWWILRRLRSTDADVRARAAKKLGEVEPARVTFDPRYARAIGALVGIATDQAWQVRLSAVRALEKAGARFVADCTAEAQPRPIRVTAQDVQSQSKPLIPTPYGASDHTIRTKAVLDAQVHAAVQERDRRARWVRCLGELKEDRIGKSLAERLDDEHSDVREAARKALSDLGKQVIEVLAAVVTDEREPREVRIAAVAALGNLGDSRATDVLIAAFGARTEISNAACDALADIGANAVEPLMAVLRRLAAHVRPPSAYTDHDRENPDFPREVVAWSVSEALGRIGTPAIARLMDALEDLDESVQAAANITLKKARGVVTIGETRKTKEFKSQFMSQLVAARPGDDLIVIKLLSNKMIKLEGVIAILVAADEHQYSQRLAIGYGTKAGGQAEILFEVPEGTELKLLRVGDLVFDVPRSWRHGV